MGGGEDGAYPVCMCVYMNSLKGVATLRERREGNGEVEVMKKETRWLINCL
jgi:hypothetical protein